MKVFVMIYLLMLPMVFANYVLNILSQGSNEHVTNQAEESSHYVAPVDGFLQFQDERKSAVGKQLPQENLYQQPITEKATTTTTNAPESDCQYWCVTPENKFYCCDDDTNSKLVENSGVCPVIRRACPVTNVNLAWHLPREDDQHVPLPDIFKNCAQDGACDPWEKCCYDSCLKKHVCKFAHSNADGYPLQYSDNGYSEEIVEVYIHRLPTSTKEEDNSILEIFQYGFGSY
ncbi:unnamed protein product [Meganyctiphanes norvegica]|uniref:WAP domain-containing protein n=1 Tax=Meganyctiphanes norvegica TaxID=48144 RepID=A0AAV2R504_MEGNR